MVMGRTLDNISARLGEAEHRNTFLKEGNRDGEYAGGGDIIST